MNKRIGTMTISGPLWLDLLNFDPNTHKIVRVRVANAVGDVELTIEGPTMPLVEGAVVQPIYRERTL